MSEILAYPFRILPGGIVATVDQNTDEANGQQIAVLVATRRGERQLVPSFGIDDPAFGQLKREDIVAGIELYGPPVAIRDITVGPIRRSRMDVQVAFE